MFDDLEDLLDDAPPPKRTTTTVNKPAAAKKSALQQKDDDEFDWEKPTQSQLTFGQSRRGTSVQQPSLGKVDSLKKQESAQTFG